MSRYGVTFYGIPGVSYYGPDSLVNFDVSPFTATASDHATLVLKWTQAAGNWTRLRLVRNSYGFPVNEQDGQILIDSAAASAPDHYTDTPLAPGHFYYYTVFLYGVAAFNGRDDWRRAGQVMALSVQDWGYTDKIVSLLPSVYTTDNQAEASPNGDADTPLYRFLSLMGFQLDYIRSEYETLLLVNDPSNVSGGLLPQMANQFGLVYEPEIGMAQLRVLLRNIQHIYKLKGTKLGIEALADSYTGWGMTSAQGVNLMLDFNDSSFEQSLGRWVATTNNTLTRYVADGSVAAFSSGANLTAGLAKMSSTASGTMTVKLANTNAVTSGVPVVASLPYTFSLYSRAGTVARTVVPQIDWYDRTGTLLSSNASAGAVNATGGFTSRVSVTASAPPNAVYAGFTVSVNSTGGAAELHYLDGVQFEQAGAATTYQEARDIRLLALANRVNECLNPSFENNVTSWAITATSTIARSTAQFLYGAASMLVTTDSVAHSPYTVTAVVPGIQTYTVSMWVYSPAGGLFRLSHLQDTPVAGSNQTSTPFVTVPAATWTRLSGTFTVPATETASRWQVIGPVSTTFYVDGVLVERGGVLMDYFDASTGITHPADYIWEGTAGNSRSHYYESRQAKTFRLQNVIKDYLWSGMTFSLLVAQPGV